MSLMVDNNSNSNDIDFTYLAVFAIIAAAVTAVPNHRVRPADPAETVYVFTSTKGSGLGLGLGVDLGLGVHL
ncbi:hypothetical protein LPJ64_002075 [Coemansia asiatica]|uniref:Uncharacterized protein n=1 Tax=Coemansia asiatica TaxID=1052880 RepID=A0A9W7XK82_9FUNG|nr:hypothetical protein LPJ64_002075 [Coemansia asiatica]KAJ2887741.1 hypothetical protein FB639_001104 [Coemansia asiatica]